jgi:hypothetical protein
MKRALSVLALIAAAGAIAGVNATGPTLSAVEQSLKTKGAVAALAQFFDCGTAGNAAYDEVANGAERWLAVAIKLLPEADGCYSLGLRDSVARAMSVRPHKVLELMETVPALGGSKTCLPFMSIDEAPELHRAYLVKLESALGTVRTPRLQRARHTCLTEIRAARARLQ